MWVVSDEGNLVNLERFSRIQIQGPAPDPDHDRFSLVAYAEGLAFPLAGGEKLEDVEALQEKIITSLNDQEPVCDLRA